MLIETVGWLKMQNRHERERGEWVQWRLRNNCDDDSHHDHDGDYHENYDDYDDVDVDMVIMMKIMMEKIYRVKIEQSMAAVSWSSN